MRFMEIEIFREPSTETLTYGKLYVNGKRFTQTMEDVVRDKKIYGETAIPAGKYVIKLRTEGQIHDRYKVKYEDIHKGMLWLQNVPNFQFVYIHTGSYPRDTLGCILVGDTILRKRDMIVESRLAYKRLYRVIIEAMNKGETVTIEIKNQTAVSQ